VCGIVVGVVAILVFQHHDIGTPGRLGSTLRDHSHRLDIRALHESDTVPVGFDEVEGVVSLGGDQNLDDPADKAPWMQAEIDYLRQAHEQGLPIVGICLGAQLLAAALGGQVAPMEEPEIGFHAVSINAAGQTDTILSGVAWESEQFCHHSQHVETLPPGASALASSKRCKVQAFRAGMRAYGFQYHFEADRAMIHRLIESAKDDLHRTGYTEEEIEQQIAQEYDSFARLSDRLCVNIASFLMPAGKLAPA
jgi:GMP synthase (glutamine-hydrolysing)